jgi:RNA polymerase sigma-70 factor (ECF subfamily)
MNAFLFAAAMLALGAPDVQAAPQGATQLYVKTVPPGAEVTVDGKTLGQSNALFGVAPGAHKLTLQMDRYVPEERAIQVRNGEITRVEVALKRRPEGEVVLSHVGDTSDAQRSFADSGHAVAFQRPAQTRSIVAVKLFASRYGYPEAPAEDFHVYLLDQNQKVLEQVSIPYRRIERGPLRWYTLDLPAIEVPEKFFVAVWFNAEQTKGVFLGMDKKVQDTHSYAGLPDKGYHKVDQSYEWMIRAVVSPESGKTPTNPKVVTYEEQKPADTESAEALPLRTWSDSSGAFSLEARFAGVDQGKVMLKKADGKTVSVPLERLSQADRDFVAAQTGPAQEAGKPGARESRDLILDNGSMASKSSIAGGGHAVRFQVDGDSWVVTSVSLHGSRYGEPRPPKEDFKVWICDAKFKPIATFEFPYGSYLRGNPVWKTFRVRPTRVPKDFIVCFGFNPQQTKGIYVSYDGQPSETSLIGVPGERPPSPFGKGNWLIRCKVEKRPESGAKTQ